MKAFWINLPEINRKIAIQAGYTSMGVSLGCHCGTIANISGYFNTPASTSPVNFHNIAVINLTKDDPCVKSVKHTAGMYAGYFFPTNQEMDTVNEYLAKNNITLDVCSDALCESLVSVCTDTPIWVLSDVINYRSQARRGGNVDGGGVPLKDSNVPLKFGINNVVLGRTYEFAEYLIKKNIGYIYESPVVQNPAHRIWGGYSLNRAWMWIPPKHLNRSLGLSRQYGEDKFPNVSDWKKTIVKDLTDSALATKKYGNAIEITEENLHTIVFDDGIFPDDKRFVRKA